jgi:hypothetical protein
MWDSMVKDGQAAFARVSQIHVTMVQTHKRCNHRNYIVPSHGTMLLYGTVDAYVFIHR